ncbi:YidC/Oxa1 family membrane protein insertase [Alicyclobacillus sp. ALC3]|uniref:YidC/Oxa1 family membrane protein insertase n=1 Tax=Alicyclobacillus sp. ALC3 TaxID=2796143 RepID=UPI0023794D64|nr:membrane protein insertase YidC [Alicyclobacillus sp. ALC3]WDL99152.1 membrane protein insertase YidC [Alicyclobacillus sp. ALC3]
MNGQNKSKPKWLWVVALTLTFSLTGCGMYPSAPGKWPHGFWGSILQAVSHVITYFANYVGYGLALIIVTIIVRLLILPLMIRQIKFSKSMQQLQPKVSEIRNKHKGDNQKIQQETMKLYQEHGFNPMSGCLPMVVQLPVLYALFGAIEGNVALHKATFLHIFQLGQPDHTFILPILAGITTYLSSRVMMTGQDTQQKMMLFIMPIFVFFMATRFASGLALYWVVGNMFMAVQSYFIRVRPAQSAQAAAVSAGKLPSRAGGSTTAPVKEQSGRVSAKGGSSSQKSGQPGSSKSGNASGSGKAKSKQAGPTQKKPVQQKSAQNDSAESQSGDKPEASVPVSPPANATPDSTEAGNNQVQREEEQ